LLTFVKRVGDNNWFLND